MTIAILPLQPEKRNTAGKSPKTELIRLSRKS